ncbi:hypothetical protein [Stratiformator vulcanicus]|uniref:Uncharacterized protein n=1 Tax=Stratiformator vulcanicus TaxID=2527980 RepID=A0A517R488_9PLAN|nr:hypothetical protein [Stratiformator vulcanicus]QDT38677.1 hypothetical protein Pan189_30730 [Stratiformator vulcanicus]
MPSLNPATLILSWLFIAISTAQAGDLGFIPGDAVFFSRLTKDFINNLEPDSGEISLSYDSPLEPGLCGHAGIWKLKITDCEPALYNRLREASPGIRNFVRAEDGTEWEVKAPHLFAYPKSYEPHYPLGLRFNEGWPDIEIEVPKLFAKDRWGTARLGSRSSSYRGHLSDPDAILYEWAHAKSVSPLPVRMPADVNWNRFADPVEEPATVRADDIRLFVIEDGALLKHYRREIKNGAEISDLSLKVLGNEESQELYWIPGGELINWKEYERRELDDSGRID